MANQSILDAFGRFWIHVVNKIGEASSNLQSSLQEEIDGKSDVGHTHSASDIASGTLSSSRLPTVPISSGGTGATTAATARKNLSIAGVVVEGTVYTIDDEEVTASNGAEVFNASANIASGKHSHAEGLKTTAFGDYSHAEGWYTTASGSCSHADGQDTTASGFCSHATGWYTTASGSYSHTDGQKTTASGECSYATGYKTTASGSYSRAAGYNTTSLDNQYVIGHYNSDGTAASTSGTTGDAFIIGKGTSTTKSNAFRVTYAGQTYAAKTTIISGADYAEFFEWKDSNLNNEDRRGYFVTMDGEEIKIAEPNDYVLGIVSGMPAVLGNGDEDWRGRYILDEFGDYIIEEFEYDEEMPVESIDEETGKVIIEMKTVKKTGTKWKENPDYDPSIPYIQREDRPEWDAIGMLGVLSVRDDGTCQVNGYCKVAEGGIATSSETGYRVIKRVNDNVVKVVFR